MYCQSVLVKIIKTINLRKHKCFFCNIFLKSYFFLDIDLKVAAKFFGTRFACGSSVTGDDEIVIQGDVKDDLFDVIPEKWPEVKEIIINSIISLFFY